MKHENDGDSSCIWCARDNLHWFGTGTGGVGNKKRSGNHQHYSIDEIGQNTEESCRL